MKIEEVVKQCQCSSGPLWFVVTHELYGAIGDGKSPAEAWKQARQWLIDFGMICKGKS